MQDAGGDEDVDVLVDRDPLVEVLVEVDVLADLETLVDVLVDPERDAEADDPERTELLLLVLARQDVPQLLMTEDSAHFPAIQLKVVTF